MVEEGAHERHIEILDPKIARPALQPGGGEAQKQGEAVRVGRDRVRACATLARQVILEEGGEMGCERRHSAPPRLQNEPASRGLLQGSEISGPLIKEILAEYRRKSGVLDPLSECLRLVDGDGTAAVLDR